MPYEMIAQVNLENGNIHRVFDRDLDLTELHCQLAVLTSAYIHDDLRRIPEVGM